MLSFELFYRFLLSRRAESLIKTISRISVIGLWLGVSALIIVVSVMNGFHRSIRSRLLSVEPHLVLEFGDLNSVSELISHPLHKKILDMGAHFVSPVSRQDVILRTTDGLIQGAVAQGVTRERLLQLFEYGEKREERRDPKLKEKIKNMAPGEIILGEGLAHSVGLFRDDFVTLIPPETLLMPADEVPQVFQALVKGFISTDIERIDDQSFYYIIDESLPRLRQETSGSLALEVWLDDPDRADFIKGKLESEHLSEKLKVETWQSRNANLFFALKMEKVVVSLLVSLSTLIAGLSIISVMVLLLTQKRKDIGHLLALGLTRRKTRALFVNIGLYLALMGIFAGVITGVLGSVLIDTFSKDVLPAFYEETNIPAEVRVSQVLLIVAFGFSFGFLTLNLTMRWLSSFQSGDVLRG